jgi:hypothetical protein
MALSLGTFNTRFQKVKISAYVIQFCPERLSILDYL